MELRHYLNPRENASGLAGKKRLFFEVQLEDVMALLSHGVQCRNFLEKLGSELGYAKLEDYYRISRSVILKNGGNSILKQYGSPYNVLKVAYPEYEWLEWRFQCVSTGFWDLEENHRRFFDWLGKQLGFHSVNDWNRLTREDVTMWKGNTMLAKYYRGSPLKALQTLYPEVNWLDWNFEKVRSGFWKDLSNCRMFLDWLGQQLGVKSMDDWYNITKDTMIQKGAGSLLRKYDSSPAKMLTSVYKEHDWMIWKFSKVNIRSWENPQIQRQYLDWLAKGMFFESSKDWYRVSLTEISKKASLTLFKKYGKAQVLPKVYPEEQWDMEKLELIKTSLKASQRILVSKVKEMLPFGGFFVCPFDLC